MTTAYDAGLPCKNRSCKSYGTPHPNCRCYPGMARGGVVSFCAETRPHEKGCAFYQDGGEVIDPGEVVPDAPAAAAPDAAEPAAAPEIDPAEVVPDAAPTSPIHPDEVVPDPPPPPQPPGTLPGEYFPLVNEPHETSPVSDMMGRIAVGTLAAEAVPGLAALGEMGRLGSIGASAIKGFISNSIIQGTDPTTKALLGQGDPEHAVGAIAAAGGVGLVLGAGFGVLGEAAEAGAKKVADLSGKYASFLAGFGSASKTPPAERQAVNEIFRPDHDAILGPVGGDFKWFEKGQGAFDDLIHGNLSKVTRRVGTFLGGVAGAGKGGLLGTAGGSAGGWLAGEMLGKPLEKVVQWSSQKFLAPVAWKIISSGSTTGLLDTLYHAEKMTKGFNMVKNASEALFKAGSNLEIDSHLSERQLEQADDYIEQGGVTEQLQQQIYQDNAPAPGFAKGGEVHKGGSPGDLGHGATQAGARPTPVLDGPSGFAVHYPTENMLLQTAKGRISSYLQGLRPGGHQPKLAFDEPMDQERQRESYERALHLAAKPLGILEEVRKGTLEPEHLKHFGAMHPELKSLLSQELAKSITKAQLKKETPPHHIRQGLSMLLGTPLSSEFSPAGIQAAQAVFQRQKQQAQAQPGQASKPKKSTAPLAKADKAYLTGSQARDMRQQKV